jgi:hypothetical protein
MVGSPCCLECSRLHIDAHCREDAVKAAGIIAWDSRQVAVCFWRGCKWIEVVQSLRLAAMDSPD